MKITSLGLFMTRRCNFCCQYCCVETGVDPPDKLKMNELQDLIKQARELGVRWITIAGEGEPLLDENLFPLLDYISSQGLAVKVYTNGSLINNSVAERLYSLGVFVMLKIHSLDPAIFDELAGRNNALEWSLLPAKWGGTKVPAALKSLLEAGYYKSGIDGIIESKLQIESVVVRRNLKCIPVIARLCKQLNIDYHVETMIPPSRPPENSERITATSREEARLFRELRTILGFRFRLQQKVRCRYETNPFIDISGNIRHCFSMEASIGNIRDTSLAELHSLELEERRAKGMISPKVFLTHNGFRVCASRRVLKG